VSDLELGLVAHFEDKVHSTATSHAAGIKEKREENAKRLLQTFHMGKKHSGKAALNEWGQARGGRSGQPVGKRPAGPVLPIPILTQPLLHAAQS